MEEGKLVVLKHVCKFCKKRFGCGRSLGGHIRCHLPKPGGRGGNDQQLIRKQHHPHNNATSSSSLSSETTEAENLSIISQQQLNHQQQQQQQQQQQRQRKRQLQQEVDIAMCLIRLSRDVGPWGDDSSSKNKRKKRRKRRGKVVQGTSKADVFTAVNGEKVVLDSAASQMKGGVEISENNGQSFNLSTEEELGKVDENQRRIISRFECNTCNKVFHSYQALGGHKASHKKQLQQQQQQEEFCNPLLLKRDDNNEKQIMMSSIINNNNNCSSPDSNEEEVVVSTEIGLGSPPKLSNKHECPICFRVFSSGQALGGHKRSHFLASSSNDNERSSSSSSIPRRHLLDLNIHPPPEQQDDTTTLATSTSSNSFVPYWWIQNNPHKLNIQLF